MSEEYESDWFADEKMGAYAFFQVDKKTKAMGFFSQKYNVPIISDPKEIKNYSTVLFSLISWRDFYSMVPLLEYKGSTEWIAGGNACMNPIGVLGMVDYVFMGDAFKSFPMLLDGVRDLPGLLSTSSPVKTTPCIEEVTTEPISDTEIIMSQGCKRGCLFCVNAWRVPYQEGDKNSINTFIKNRKGKGVYLSSNSFDDVSFSDEVSQTLADHCKSNMVVSNSFSALTDHFVDQRRGEILIGIEGMSERLRTAMRKPIPQKAYREKMVKMLRDGKNIRTVYQLNLPGESEEDWAEFVSDVEYITERVGAGSWAIPFIPNQPSPMTPLQWCAPTYDMRMAERIMAFRNRYSMGNDMNGVKLVIPPPLYPKKWMMQIVAEYIPVSIALCDAFKSMKDKLSVGDMAAHLKRCGCNVDAIIGEKSFSYVFPWDSVVEYYTGKEQLWSRYTKIGTT
jgi:radical SAM superfamily enzyme YgiQ (UPF0313 family)